MPATPVTFSQELAERICEEIATGSHLKEICAREGMPDRKTVFRWVLKYPDFKTAYHLAQEFRSVVMAEDIIEIADDGTNDFMEKIGRDGKPYQAVDVENINRSRLRVDTRKWAMANMWPAKYGNKVAHGGDPTAAPIRHAIEMVIVDPTDAPADTGSEET